jgi:hypothetical protein
MEVFSISCSSCYSFLVAPALFLTSKLFFPKSLLIIVLFTTFGISIIIVFVVLTPFCKLSKYLFSSSIPYKKDLGISP